MHAGFKPSSPTRGHPTAALPRRQLLLGMAAALMSTALPACAHDANARTPPVAVSLIDRATGAPLPLYRKDGRAYVPGSPASRYTIRLANQTGGRVLVVLSVDGVNVISGQTAALSQTGYVLDPWRSYDIAGWRKTDTEIAAFEFAALSDSYAARTGRPANVGVVGAAMFLEAPAAVALAPAPSPLRLAELDGTARADLARPQDEPAKAARQAAAPTPPAPGAESTAGARSESRDAAARAATVSGLVQNNERLGTAHGQREWSVSTRTAFERLSSSPQAVVEIAYDSLPNLIAAGVVPRPIARVRAFPGEDGRGFVPDPPAR